jgi:hypothetical protein
MQFPSDATVNDALEEIKTPADILGAAAVSIEAAGLDASLVFVAATVAADSPSVDSQQYFAGLANGIPELRELNSPAAEVLIGVLVQLSGQDYGTMDDNMFTRGEADNGLFHLPSFSKGSQQMALNNQTPLDEARANQLVDEFFKKKPVVNEGNEQQIARMLGERSVREDEDLNGSRATTAAQRRAGERIRLEGREAARAILSQVGIFGDD